MTNPLLIDFFCSAGGASRGYSDAGFDVVGVDHVLQPRYPFPFILGDALDVLQRLIDGEGIEASDGRIIYLADVAVIAASPPCQRYTTLGIMPNVNPENHPDLVGATRDLLIAAGKPYIIENVPGAPLNSPIQLCGSSFGLRVRKHRLFELSHFLLAPPCQHHWQDSNPIYTVRNHGKNQKAGVCYVFGTGGSKGGDWNDAMGINWMTRAELSQAIPPAYCEFIGRQMRSILKI